MQNLNDNRVIVNINNPNDVWGAVLAEETTCYRLKSGRIAKKSTEGTKWQWQPSLTEPIKEDSGEKKITPELEAAIKFLTENEYDNCDERMQKLTSLMSAVNAEKKAEREKSRFIVSIAESPWSDLGTRVITASNEEEALNLWDEATESGSRGAVEALKKMGKLIVYKIGRGDVSDVISITTG